MHKNLLDVKILVPFKVTTHPNIRRHI